MNPRSGILAGIGQAQPAAPEPGSRAGRGRAAGPRGTAWLLAWLAFLPVAVLRAGTLAESDTFWEIRTGLLTVSHRAIPAVDSFSWTMRGKPWTLNSWGFNVAAAAAYRWAGLTGVAWMGSLLVMAAAGLTLLLARQLGASPLVAGLMLGLASPWLIGFLSARPQLIDYIAVPGLVILLRQVTGGAGGRARWVIAVGLLSFAWVNLHAAALLGAAITGASAAALLTRRATRADGWWCAAAAAAALTGSLVNPYGPGVLTQTATVASSSAGLVTEWQHLDPASPAQWVILAMGAAALILAARRRDAVAASTLAVAAAGAVIAVRLQPVLVLIAVPVLSAAASRPPVLRYIRSRRLVLYPGALAGFVALAVMAMPSLGHIGRPSPASYPLNVVQDIPRGCRLYNSYLLGGFVILERPDVPVSLDSRSDLYGAQRIRADLLALEGRGVPASELKGAGCALIPPTSGLAGQLRRDPAWQVRASAAAAVLFVRR